MGMELFVIFVLIQSSVAIDYNTYPFASAMSLKDTIESISALTSVLMPSNLTDFSLLYAQVKFSEDGLLNFTGLSTKYIRRTEEYDVITEDGYILKLFHIPGNVNKVLLICHGILVSSDSFLARGNTSLIYTIAEQGFDIWAMNIRGNRYSRRHVILNPDTDRQFWEFSMNEIGKYDYKAIIDFILDKTGQEKLSVIAHSEGTSAFFVLTAERPEYNAKVKIFIGLAPVCYLRNSGPTLTNIFKLQSILIIVIRALFPEFIGYYSLNKKVIDVICTQGEVGYKLCFNVLGSVTGFNPANIEQEFASTILGHFPAGTSGKNLVHYAYINRYNNFVKYDYGMANYAVYGSPVPPVYDLKKVTTKVALFAAKSDKIVGIKDVERLRMELTNVIHYQVVSDDNFNHIDYMWGRNAHVVLYPYVVDILLKYS